MSLVYLPGTRTAAGLLGEGTGDIAESFCVSMNPGHPTLDSTLI